MSPHHNPYEDAKTALVAGAVGRDAGKTFRINEVAPVTMAGFVLRLLAALRLGELSDFMDLLQPRDSEGPGDLRLVLRVLTGCDPQAVGALIHDALTYVEVAADPKHPTTFRPLADDDIREMSTLGDVLGAFVRVNLLPAA